MVKSSSMDSVIRWIPGSPKSAWYPYEFAYPAVPEAIIAEGIPFTRNCKALGEVSTCSEVTVLPVGKVSSIHPAAMNAAESIAIDLIKIFFILRYSFRK